MQACWFTKEGHDFIIYGHGLAYNGHGLAIDIIPHGTIYGLAYNSYGLAYKAIVSK